MDNNKNLVIAVLGVALVLLGVSYWSLVTRIPTLQAEGVDRIMSHLGDTLINSEITNVSVVDTGSELWWCGNPIGVEGFTASTSPDGQRLTEIRCMVGFRLLKNQPSDLLEVK